MIYQNSKLYNSPPGVEALSVSDLTKCIKGILESEDLFRDVWVRGEISNFVNHASGHRYFSLKDKGALIRCVIWNSSQHSVKTRLADGMNVIARGRVSVYEKQGQYQLTVSELIPDGAGALYAAYEQLKAKLESEGVFDKSRKKRVPSFPRKVVIVTSRTAAALRDMVTIARRRMPSVDLLLVPALMQGVDSESSVIESLSLADKARADVIVLGRGGGSIEDLWTFNSEDVVRALNSCQTPTVSAIGHETDFTLCDFAADLRAPTPSAAMELIIPDQQHCLQQLGAISSKISSCLESCMSARKSSLDRLVNSSVLRFPERMLEARAQSLDMVTERLQSRFSRILASREMELCESASKLNSLSPLSVLSRGYGIVRRLDNGKVIRKVSEAAPGIQLETLLGDGRLISQVTDVKEGWE